MAEREFKEQALATMRQKQSTQQAALKKLSRNDTVGGDSNLVLSLRWFSLCL